MIDQKHLLGFVNVELGNIQVNLSPVEVDNNVNPGAVHCHFPCARMVDIRERETRCVDYCSRCREVASTG